MNTLTCMYFTLFVAAAATAAAAACFSAFACCQLFLNFFFAILFYFVYFVVVVVVVVAGCTGSMGFYFGLLPELILFHVSRFTFTFYFPFPIPPVFPLPSALTFFSAFPACKIFWAWPELA